MPTLYYSILNNSEIIERETLQELTDIKYLTIFIRKELHHVYTSPDTYANQYHFYKYTFVTKENKKEEYKAGEFEIIDISEEYNRYKDFSHREILIRDNTKNCFQKFKSIIGGSDFIIKELVPLIQTLSIIPNWEMSQKILQYDKINSELNDFTNKFKDLESKYKILLAQQKI